MTLAINYWAVLVSALASFVLGALWYSPLLFGKLWIKQSGFTQKDMEKAKKEGMALSYLLNFLATLVTAYVLAHFVELIGAFGYVEALVLGFWAWLGFVATIGLGGVLWEKKPVSLYAINMAYHLVSLMGMSLILTLWL